MKQSLLIISLIFIGSIYAFSQQPPDSCLKMIWDNEEFSDDPFHTGYHYVNPDSVKVDSCIGSPTYGKLFAKRYFYLNFLINNFPFDYQLKPDSIKRVTDISNSKPELKAQFQQLESQFGTIYFQGFIYEQPGSDFLQNPGCRMTFELYQDIADVESVFASNIDSLRNIIYANRAMILVSVDENVENLNNIQIYPNPVKNILDLKFLQSSNFEMISIYNLNGLKVFESNYDEQINVSELQPGIYFLRYGNKSYKFLKE